MEENKSDQNQNELNDSNANNSKKETPKSTPKESEEKKESIKDNPIKKLDNDNPFKSYLHDYVIHSNSDNLSKYLSSDFNTYLTSSIFETDILKNRIFLPDSTLDNQLKLADEINDLRKKLKKSAEDLKDAKADRENKITEFEKLKAELTAKEKTNHILSRISEDGRKKLLESEPFHKLFKNSSKYDTVVVAIDIRRSTELMLKARTPELFSKFITELSFKLSQIIIANYGIFDKFTGDGIMAFFPKFYSGNEAIIRALKASKECHLLFKEHYNNSKECFNVFIKDVGLGIGIDFGNVTLVNTQSELTVVGIPVVYACRFSGAKAGETLLNQPAKEEIMKLCPTTATFNEGEINIKNEGVALGYNVSLNEAAFDVPKPNWDELITEYGIE
jgi:class 3 adenylate cyclase